MQAGWGLFWHKLGARAGWYAAPYCDGNPSPGEDWQPLYIEPFSRYGDVFDALLQIQYHTGYGIRLDTRGNHGGPYPVITIKDYEFANIGSWDRIIAWSHAIEHREPNTPIPEPPDE